MTNEIADNSSQPVRNWLHICASALLPMDQPSLVVQPLSISFSVEGAFRPLMVKTYSPVRDGKPYPNWRIRICSPKGQRRITDGFLISCPDEACRLVVATRWHVRSNHSFEASHIVHAALGDSKILCDGGPDDCFIWSLNPETWIDDNGRELFRGPTVDWYPRFIPFYERDYHLVSPFWRDMETGGRGEVFVQHDYLSVPAVRLSAYINGREKFGERLWPHPDQTLPNPTATNTDPVRFAIDS